MAVKREELTLDWLRSQCDVQPEDEGGCWLWTGAVTTGHTPYPKVQVKGEGAHLVRRLAVGIRDGRQPGPGAAVFCDCESSLCVRPDHQKRLTREQRGKEMNGRMHSMKRVMAMALAMRRKAKLDTAKVAAIKSSSESDTALAARYGVNRATVSKVRRGQIWKTYGSPFAGGLL